LFRHGDRIIEKSAQESYPNDPYKDMDFYPDGDGELTIVRSDLYVIVDTLHHFINLIIIKTVPYDINF